MPLARFEKGRSDAIIKHPLGPPGLLVSVPHPRASNHGLAANAHLSHRAGVSTANQGLTLRGARQADAQELAGLSLEAFGEFDPDAARRGAVLTSRNGVVTSVAEWDGRLAGFAALSQQGRRAWLDAIAVTLRCRGRGAGRALLERVVQQARERGATSLGLATADSNVAALALFLHQGFRVTERKARYYPRGQDAVLMTKTL